MRFVARDVEITERESFERGVEVFWRPFQNCSLTEVLYSHQYKASFHKTKPNVLSHSILEPPRFCSEDLRCTVFNVISAVTTKLPPRAHTASIESLVAALVRFSSVAGHSALFGLISRFQPIQGVLIALSPVKTKVS